MDRENKRNRHPWFVFTVATGLTCLFTWWSPDSKSHTALGRFNYAEFMLALGTSLVFVSILCVAVTKRRKRRRRLIQIVSIWISGSATLLCVEVIATLVPRTNNPFYNENTDDLLADDSEGAKLPYTRPPHINWEGWSRGDLAVRLLDQTNGRWLTFQTDADGFRNSKDIKQADLVFIGDSFTEAGNVLEEESFVRLTATKLNLTARNLGLCGYPPPAELVVLQRYGLKCDPKLVVWQICEGNDLVESRRYADWRKGGYPSTEQPDGTSRWEQQSITHLLFRCFVRHERNWWAGDYHRADGSHCEVRFLFVPSPDQIPIEYYGRGQRVEHLGWKPIVAALKQGSRQLKQLRISLLVVFIPTKLTVMGQFIRFDDWSQEKVNRLPALRIPKHMSMATQLKGVCDELDVVFVDTTEALEAKAADGELVYYPLDSHLTPLGHEVVSRLVVDTITDVTKKTNNHE